MKNLSYLFLLCMIGLSLETYSQSIGTIPTLGDPIPYLESICYDEDFVEKVKVVATINTSTLSIAEKIMLLKKNYKQSHKEYIKDATYPVHDLKYISHENIFPKWYIVADRITMDETGTKSYFIQYNNYLTGGWVGANETNDEAGQYGVDSRNGQKYYWQYHSTTGQQFYNQMQSQIITSGFLSKFYFAKPSTQMLQNFTQNGYSTQITTNFIKVWNSEIRYTWRLNTQEFVIELLSNTVVTSTTVTKYKYYVQFGQYLKDKEITITPETFGNGDCYDHITEVVVSNYNACGNPELRTSDGHKNAYFSIFPNPSSDLLTINIPFSDKPTQIEIITISGESIRQMIIENKVSDAVDISNVPSGVYIISMKQGENVENLKFVKI